MIDNIFVIYKNSDKFFPTYDDAWKNSRKPFQQKQVYYVFTPTMQECKRVSELENLYRKYFNKTVDCDFYDIINKKGTKQLKLIGEL